MTDTVYADISEWNEAVRDDYPYKFIAIRSNDGTYTDQHFADNLKWAKKAVDSGKLTGFIVYFVWEPNWRQTLVTFKEMVGTPHPSMAVMLDVETWGKKLAGDHSPTINATREHVVTWLGKSMTLTQRLKKLHRKRVIGYGNGADLAALWPRRGDTRVVLANYSGNPAYPGKIAHQYTNNAAVPGFQSPVDLNSADGFTPVQFAAALGLPVPAKHSVPPPPVKPSTPDMAHDIAKRLAALEQYISSTYGGSK